jgi:hypothetical protein
LSSQDIYSWNDAPAFSLPQSFLAMLNYLTSLPLLVWFKLNPHFWKQFTIVVCVTQRHDSAMKCSASKIFTFVSVASWSNLCSII